MKSDKKELDKNLTNESHESAKQAYEEGKKLRKKTPRSSHANWKGFEGRPNPVELLEKQGESRVEELLPIRYERMGASPFTFYRGTALIMATDLAHTPYSGIEVQVCGDAHVSNFGIFASSERKLVFDINDFDETALGPWEWDVKRLAASLEICGRDRGFSKDEREKIVFDCVKSYQTAMQKSKDCTNLNVWYASLNGDSSEELANHFGAENRKKVEKLLKKASKKDSSRAIKKLTENVDGQIRFKSDPPLIVPLREMAESKKKEKDIVFDGDIVETLSRAVLEEYYKSVSPEKQNLLKQYKTLDIARKVVGVGSVGTRVWIMAMQGQNVDDYLVLQIKEAENSVIDQVLNRSRYDYKGQRVVEGQHAIQSSGDPFLGWTQPVHLDNIKYNFYVRQLWDCKGSIDLDDISFDGLDALGQLCGACLSHAHARTGDRFRIAGYLGNSDSFANAIVEFANSYADQNDRDYELFMEKYGDYSKSEDSK